MSWKAPAAMYFVISVFPISMTSGALPPASVASNFCRCVRPRLVLDVGRRRPMLASETAGSRRRRGSGHPFCASFCSHTVMLAVESLLFAAAIADVTKMPSTATSARAANGAYFHIRSPRGIWALDSAVRMRRGSERGRSAAIGLVPLCHGREASHIEPRLSRPRSHDACRRMPASRVRRRELQSRVGTDHVRAALAATPRSVSARTPALVRMR